MPLVPPGVAGAALSDQTGAPPAAASVFGRGGSATDFGVVVEGGAIAEYECAGERERGDGVAGEERKDREQIAQLL